MTYIVRILPKDTEQGATVIEDVIAISLIDNNSHGPAALGNLDELEDGGKRVLICAPNVTAVVIEDEFV